MKVLLIFPHAELSYRPMSAPLGLLSIASYLNANGHSAAISTEAATNRKIRESILAHQPDIIGVSVISFAYIKNAIRISKIAKKLGKTVVWGGTMASAIPKQILESGIVDYVSFREGEQTWLEMANAFNEQEPFDQIKGLAFIKDGNYTVTPARELMDLAVLPKLDWTLVDPTRFFTPTYGCRKSMHIYWSKGCIGNCTFCYNKEFHCSVRRQRPLEFLIEEMRFLIDRYGVDGFEFTDDLMFENTDQLHVFCSAIIESGMHICWTGYERIGIIKTQADYDLLYRSGCRCLMFGIETGSKRMQKMLHKSVSEEKILADVEMCHKAGIIPLSTFMLGLPGETEQDIKATVDLLGKFGHYSVGINLYTPQPGTDLFDQLVAENKVKPLDSLKDLAKVRWGDKQYAYTAQLPKKELQAIESYYRFRSMFFRYDSTPKKHFRDTVKNVLRAMRSSGLIGFFFTGVRVFLALSRFATLFLHPGIRKKYNLYFD